MFVLGGEETTSELNVSTGLAGDGQSASNCCLSVATSSSVDVCVASG
jgi:hypothetical protein